MSKTMLWVEVDKTTVTMRTGAKMPEPTDRSYYLFSLGSDNSFTREEFKRWSGVTFPKGDGIYGLEVKMAVVKKMRVVVEKDYVAAQRTTRKLVEVK